MVFNVQSTMSLYQSKKKENNNSNSKQTNTQTTRRKREKRSKKKALHNERRKKKKKVFKKHTPKPQKDPFRVDRVHWNITLLSNKERWILLCLIIMFIDRCRVSGTERGERGVRHDKSIITITTSLENR